MAEPAWKPLRQVERDSEVEPGVIALPKSLAQSVGGKGDLRVRCKNPPTPEEKEKLGPAPEIVLTIVEQGTSHAMVGPSAYRTLGVGEFGLTIEGRRLGTREWIAREASRLALPILVPIAGVASLVGLLCSKAAPVTEVITVIAALPAALWALRKASTDPG